MGPSQGVAPWVDGRGPRAELSEAGLEPLGGHAPGLAAVQLAAPVAPVQSQRGGGGREVWQQKIGAE